MELIESFSKMMVILAAIGAGCLANRLGIMGGEMDQKITKLILNITQPLMILGSVAGGELPPSERVMGILGVSVVFYGLEFLMAAAAPRFLGGTPKQKSVWRFALCFPNVGFIGIPVVTSFFGSEAVLYAFILMIPFNILSYALGPMILSGGFREFSVRKMLNPGVVASLITLVMTLARWQPPALIGECVNFLGDVTVPLSLMLIGSLLAGIPAGKVFGSVRLWVVSALRLLVLPTLLWAILTSLGADPLVMGVAVTQIAMPVAANGSMFCMEYGGDSQCMARVTFLTTILSMVTAPLLAAVLHLI